MKKIISSVIVLVALAAISSKVNAQLTVPVGYTWTAPTGSESIDSVTVGSVIPYRVSGDPNMHALRLLGILNYSNYTKAASVGGTIRAFSGVAASTPAAADSAFSVIWNTVGAQTVSVTEVPVVVSGPAFSCTANTQTLNVAVLSRPTAALGASASASGCGVAGTTVTIPYTATGTGLFDISYRIHFTPLSGAASDVVTTTSTGVGNLTNGTQNANLSYAVPGTAYGRYDVYITNVTDRISRKSGITTSLAADLPAAAVTFYAYPVPATQSIQHVRNL